MRMRMLMDEGREGAGWEEVPFIVVQEITWRSETIRREPIMYQSFCKFYSKIAHSWNNYLHE